MEMTVEKFENICVSRFLITPPSLIENQEKLIDSLNSAVDFVRAGGSVTDVRDRFELCGLIPAYRDLSKVSQEKFIEWGRTVATQRAKIVNSAKENLAQAIREFRGEFKVEKVNKVQLPCGDECGRPGIVDIVITEVASGVHLHVVVRNLFDVGNIVKIEKIDGTLDAELVKRAERWILKWSPLGGIRM